MNIVNCSDYREMSRMAATLVLEALAAKPDLLLCAATGSSPEGLYKELSGIALGNTEAFNQLRVIKLDEWGGIPENHPVSCEYYLKTKLLGPLDIKSERYISLQSDPEDPALECSRIRSRLEKEGSIDVCILGLGRNGHLGLNEPAGELEPNCHVAALTIESLKHPMIASLESKPSYGLTLGMDEILASRQIIMLLSGSGKKTIAKKFLEATISNELPASYLWKHSQVECLVDSSILD
jgi:galactosamine-6-phosphate isomerase